MTDEPMLKNAAKPARRRTQAERSNATRTAVCEATLDALIEYGYERISTTLIAEKAKEANIGQVVFDRNGYLYHGRVKALADGAREGGLQF